MMKLWFVIDVTSHSTHHATLLKVCYSSVVLGIGSRHHYVTPKCLQHPKGNPHQQKEAALTPASGNRQSAVCRCGPRTLGCFGSDGHRVTFHIWAVAGNAPCSVCRQVLKRLSFRSPGSVRLKAITVHNSSACGCILQWL